MNKLFFVIAQIIFLSGCSNVGPGFANHPIACSMGIAWDDCLPGTKGWDNGGGRIYREGAQKVLDKHTPQEIMDSSGSVIR